MKHMPVRVVCQRRNILHLLLGPNNDFDVALIHNASQSLHKHLRRCVILVALEITELTFGCTVTASACQSTRLHRCVHFGIHVECLLAFFVNLLSWSTTNTLQFISFVTSAPIDSWLCVSNNTTVACLLLYCIRTLMLVDILDNGAHV